MRNNPAVDGLPSGSKFPSVKASSGGRRNVPASNRAQSESVRRPQFSSSRLGLRLMPIDNISISTTHDTKYFMLSGLNVKGSSIGHPDSAFNSTALSSIAASLHARAHVVGWIRGRTDRQSGGATR